MQRAIGDPAIAAFFTPRFVEASERYDRLIDAAAWRILERLGALPRERGIRPEEEAVRLQLAGPSHLVFFFLFRKLADSGFLAAEGHAFRSAGSPPDDFASLKDASIAAEPEGAAGAEIVALLVDESEAFFHGEKTGEEILFSPVRLPLWFRYFSNANILYSINNLIGAEVLERDLPPSGAVLLEVGGGAGSAAEVALRRAGSRIARYRFTELVPSFLRRGERAARAAADPGTAVEAFRLDMTAPWEPQGVPPGSVDLVYSVNCFHVATDLDALLQEARTALRPGGTVVVSECLKPRDPFRPIYVDFVFEFLRSFTNVTTHPTKRPAHGFLTPAAWKASFEASGFRDVTVHPDVERLGGLFRNFFAGAVVARR